MVDLKTTISAVEKEDIWSVKTDIITVSKDIQRFYDVIDTILNLKEITVESLSIVLKQLEVGCKEMTENHCRILWKEGNEKGLDIKETCKACGFYLNCLQNPDNQKEDRMYYNIALLWDYIKKVVDKKTTLDTNIVIDYIKKIKLYNIEVDSFKTVITDWSK